MTTCSIPKCDSNRPPFFNLPEDGELRRQKWLEAIGLNNTSNVIDLSKIQICSQHFEANLIDGNTLKVNAIPTLHLCASIDDDNEYEEICRDNIRLRKMLAKKRKNRDIIKSKLKALKNTLVAPKRSLSEEEQLDLLRKVFSESQIKVLRNVKRVRWSDEDMAIAYTLRHLGGHRCYGYLSNNLKIPLPGISSLQRWVSIKNNDKPPDKPESDDGI